MPKIPLRRLHQLGSLVSLVSKMPRDDPRFALFLGSGASISSGIPAVQTLIRRWQRQVFMHIKNKTGFPHQHETEFTSWLRDEYPAWKKREEEDNGHHPSEYSFLFNYLYPTPENRQGYIEKLLEDCEPGPGYIYLASLARVGIFRTYLTTNFDDLIHDAIFRYVGLKPAVCAFDSQISSIRLDGPRQKIIKLHGDFLYNNLRNVGTEVGHLGKNMEHKFLRTCENHGLIVIGYDGNDRSVMAPIRTMLHQDDRLTNGLHWCIYCPSEVDNNDASSALADVEVSDEVKTIWESYPGKVTLYKITSFDDAMAAIYYGCDCEPPPELAHPEVKALYARLRDGLENADQTWRLKPQFHMLMNAFRNASYNKPPQAATILDSADEQHRIGAKALSEKRYDIAKRHFVEAIAKAKKVLEKEDQRIVHDIEPSHLVWAFRRRSGDNTSLADALLRDGYSRDIKKAPKKIRGEFQQLAIGAIEDARRGLEECRKLAFPASLRGHRRNLYFNGLIGFANLLYSRGKLNTDELREASDWLRNLTVDEVFGDEYFQLLRDDELGGKQLVIECEKFLATPQ